MYRQCHITLLCALKGRWTTKEVRVVRWKAHHHQCERVVFKLKRSLIYSTDLDTVFTISRDVIWLTIGSRQLMTLLLKREFRQQQLLCMALCYQKYWRQRYLSLGSVWFLQKPLWRLDECASKNRMGAKNRRHCDESLRANSYLRLNGWFTWDWLGWSIARCHGLRYWPNHGCQSVDWRSCPQRTPVFSHLQWS